MSDKFQDKYRIQSARLPHWDYRWAGAYFITICTKDRFHYFGEIIDGRMILSNVGVLANVFWYEIKNHTKNVTLGEFIVMPNHIHGILKLNELPVIPILETLHITIPIVETLYAAIPAVETLHATSLQDKMAEISPKSNSVSTMIRSYKSAVTKHANRLGFEFGWQTRFHDHIIRDEQSFDTISNYIINNPAKWKDDTFYKNELL